MAQVVIINPDGIQQLFNTISSSNTGIPYLINQCKTGVYSSPSPNWEQCRQLRHFNNVLHQFHLIFNSSLLTHTQVNWQEALTAIDGILEVLIDIHLQNSTYYRDLLTLRALITNDLAPVHNGTQHAPPPPPPPERRIANRTQTQTQTQATLAVHTHKVNSF